MEHTGGLITPSPGAEDAEPVIQIPVGLPCLEGALSKNENNSSIFWDKEKKSALGYLKSRTSFMTGIKERKRNNSCCKQAVREIDSLINYSRVNFPLYPGETGSTVFKKMEV